MDPKNGYKLTDVGVIPDDWNVTTLSAISTQIGDGIHSTPNYSKSSDYFFVNGNNLANDRIVITDDTMRVSESEYLKLGKNLTGRTLLLSINGTIGNLAFYRGEKVVLGKSAAYINLNDKVSKEFVAYCLKNRPTTVYFENELTGTTIRNLSLQSLRNTPLPLPNTEAEQSAIADTLSDVDALLDSLDQLIGKKRDLKQAAMQQLLTAGSDWLNEKLEKIADVIDPHPSHRAPVEVSNGILFVGIGDVDEDGNIIGERIRRVAASVYDEHSKRYDLSDRLIGIGRVASIGKIVSLASVENRYVISPTLGVIRATKIDRDYLIYTLRSRSVADQFARIISGSTRSSVGMVVLRKLDIVFPRENSEQKAIAAIFLDIDEELLLLEKQRKKARDLKQAMMQELLTGETRLV